MDISYALEMPGGLKRGDHRLPRTIQDAMAFVLGIGQRYLWVDALCIVQDDSNSKETQIKHMGSVYHAALFTIIASGRDADAGLPGVREGSRNEVQYLETVRGMKLAIRPFRVRLSVTPWAKRACTRIVPLGAAKRSPVTRRISDMTVSGGLRKA